MGRVGDGGRWGRGRSDDCSGEGVSRVSWDFPHPMRQLEREGHTCKVNFVQPNSPCTMILYQVSV